MQVSEPFFREYEAAVESFLRNGGHTPSIIRSPRKLLDQFRAAFPHETEYLGARFELTGKQSYPVPGIRRLQYPASPIR